MAESDRPRLESNAMGTGGIVFFVLAAAAPMASREVADRACDAAMPRVRPPR